MPALASFAYAVSSGPNAPATAPLAFETVTFTEPAENGPKVTPLTVWLGDLCSPCATSVPVVITCVALLVTIAAGASQVISAADACPARRRRSDETPAKRIARTLFWTLRIAGLRTPKRGK